MAWRAYSGKGAAGPGTRLPARPAPTTTFAPVLARPTQARPGGQPPLPGTARGPRPAAIDAARHVATYRPIARPSAPVGAAEVSAAETYVVYSKGSDDDEVVVRTLIGEYLESGHNHNRKVYKKVGEKGGEAVDVFLYYWDARDGPAFEGWWFGNKLGGTQVWSHCVGDSLKPPHSGWKIPWDGKPSATLMVVSKAQRQQADVEEKVQTVAGDVAEAERKAELALEQARATVGDYSTPEGIRVAEQLLLPEISGLNASLKMVTEKQRGSTGEVLKRLTQLGAQLRTMQNSVNAELAKLRSSKAKAEQSERLRALEEKDLSVWNEVLVEAIAKTNSAEDAVEKAVITSEMISASGEDLNEVKQAVTQTEVVSQDAQKTIGEARIFLNAKVAQCRRFESETVRKKSQNELSKLQATLGEAQNKLNPLKTVRQEFAQRSAAQKMVQEILQKLSPAEVDVDRAEEVTLLLGTETLSKELMQQAEQAVWKATEHVATVSRFIDQKKKAAVGMAREEITKMEERVTAARQRLTQFRASHKEASERLACDILLKEAAEKLQAVAETVSKAADAEGPFLMGVEELPLDETLAAVKACETAATSANTAVSIARMFIATKIVEAKRFSAAPSQDALVKLKEHQIELEMQSKKLAELKSATAARKKAVTIREAEDEVNKAEELTKRVIEVASVFEDDAKLVELSSSAIRAASDGTIKAEQEANKALAEARKFITARQIEAKGKESSAEISADLVKFQTRLSAAQVAVTKSKKLTSTVEQRLAAKKIVEEAKAKLQEADDKVSRLEKAVAALQEGGAGGEHADGSNGDRTEDKSDKQGGQSKQIKDMEQAAAEAQVFLKSVYRFLEVQVRPSGAARDEIGNMQPTLRQTQDRLDAAIKTMHEQAEKLVVADILREAIVRVKEAEESVKKVAAAEEPFAQVEELPMDEASGNITDLESLVSVAHSVVGSAKTFLAMKRLAAKRLSETSEKAAAEELTQLQAQLEKVGRDLTRAKKGMAERKLKTVKREVEAKVEEVEKQVEAAVEATTSLAECGGSLAPEAMKSACEKAGSTQHAAQSGLAAARDILLNRQRDAKVISADTCILTEISNMLDRVTKAQADLDKQKSLLREQEHSFVARRLLQDATQQVERLENKVGELFSIIAPLTSETEEFAASVFLSHAIDALRANMKTTNTTAKALCEALCASGMLVEERFVAKISNLPEIKDHDDAFLSEEQIKIAFSQMKSKSGEGVAESMFLDQFRNRYICTAAVSMTETLIVKGGKTVRKLEMGEIVEALEEPVKDEASGLVRMKAKAEKDEKDGWISLAGNQGTVYFEPYSCFAACQRRVDAALKELGDCVKATLAYVDLKSDELKSVRTGPLSETKAELAKMRPRITKVQSSYQALKRKVADADKRHKECMEAEQKRRRENAEKKAAATIVSKVEESLSRCNEQVDRLFTHVDKLLATKLADDEKLLSSFDTFENELETALASIAETNATIKSSVDGIKPSNRGPFTDARAALNKLKVKTGALESKCKKYVGSLKIARTKVADDAYMAVTGVLRAHVQKNRIRPLDLFKQLGKDGKHIPKEALHQFVSRIEDSHLKASELDLGLDRFKAGVTKLRLLDMLQEYEVCIKDIAITTAFDVKESKTIRKLLTGEVVEVLEAGVKDEATGLARVRCRALVDHKEGWATLRGNQGTTFMEKTLKPYYCCKQASFLQSGFDSGSVEVAQIHPGEVLEVLEGPVKEASVETERVQGKALKDGKVGWLTLKDACGDMNIVPSKLLVCQQSIAITTAFDITSGKAIRKLDVGETLEILEGPIEDPTRNLQRVKARTKNDGTEGWVTIKGNQGTAYVEETDKLHVCMCRVPFDALCGLGSNCVRSLEKGEVFEVIHGPIVAIKDGETRVRVRHLGDATEGWCTLTGQNMERWSAIFKCSQSTVINSSVEIREAKVVRKLEGGEFVEALDTPVMDEVTGVMRIRVRAERDGVVGFVSVRGNQGTVLLRPVFSEL